MKMVKSLVLGTAVAFAATVGAQAADMPVKAKPVSYVKICPQDGPGFYYIPGTDICLKVGGLLLAEVGYNARGAITFNAYSNAVGATGFNGTTNYVNVNLKKGTYVIACFNADRHSAGHNHSQYGMVRKLVVK